MFDLQRYLSAIGKCVGKPVSLYRDNPGKSLQPITDVDKDIAYLKPDAGYGSRLHTYYVKTSPGDETVTTFALYEFPSCCAFCVSTRVIVEPKFRSKGVNNVANKLRQAIARECGYSALLCTDVESNRPERHTLITNEFQDIYRIRNKRTTNTVIISVKEL